MGGQAVRRASHGGEAREKAGHSSIKLAEVPGVSISPLVIIRSRLGYHIDDPTFPLLFGMGAACHLHMACSRAIELTQATQKVAMVRYHQALGAGTVGKFSARTLVFAVC